ncbi:PTS sugar transporter subunit IIB [Culicoidibacter larvae]|uniref:PTS sugar transporter subunit IIB n=1 Tax=Culicoidibacter larvae TaxID=2579976 RepID=A0A5R8QAI6_9FIRM|nr:PTS sugar transporter subunit IIB [Culicoidibacter larvae]TLG72926.1 PTS sugar transporter subunit IIB [Culicoidibacter larvae]
MDGYQILVVCTAGISSSFLVRRMLATNKQNDCELRILSIGESELPSHWQDADIVLLGPQVRYQLEKVCSLVEYSIPVVAISMERFGMLDGEAVLKDALAAIADYHYRNSGQQ